MSGKLELGYEDGSYKFDPKRAKAVAEGLVTGAGFDLTVDNNGTIWGFSGLANGFGSLTWTGDVGFQVEALEGNPTTDLCNLAFVGGGQVGGHDEIVVDFTEAGGPEVALVFNVFSYQATSAELSDWLVASDAATVAGIMVAS